MAPRGRPRKRGNTRMDAAVDAMADFGFEPSAVRKSVKHLLSVYGGDEYWVFIERDSYRVLIDYILDNHQDSHGDESKLITGGTLAIGASASIELSDADKIHSKATQALELTGTEEDNVEALMMIEYGGAPLKMNKRKKNRRRRAYHGWISDDNGGDLDDVVEENDVLFLTREPLAKALHKIVILQSGI